MVKVFRETLPGKRDSFIESGLLYVFNYTEHTDDFVSVFFALYGRETKRAIAGDDRRDAVLYRRSCIPIPA